MTDRNVKFPVLMGGGMVAAGALLYFANVNVHARAGQESIMHRDGEVRAGEGF